MQRIYSDSDKVQTSDLVLSFDFDDIDGNKVHDKSGNNNDGVLVGSTVFTS